MSCYDSNCYLWIVSLLFWFDLFEQFLVDVSSTGDIPPLVLAGCFSLNGGQGLIPISRDLVTLSNLGRRDSSSPKETHANLKGSSLALEGSNVTKVDFVSGLRRCVQHP